MVFLFHYIGEGNEKCNEWNKMENIIDNFASNF